MSLRTERQASPVAVNVPSGRQLSARFQALAVRIIFYALLIGAAALFTVPVLWLLISSLKTNAEYGRLPIQFFPARPMWENYVEAVTRINYLAAAGRSLLLGALNSVPLVLSSALVGYGFARFVAPGRRILFIVMLSMIMVPGLVTTIPLFVLYSRLGLVGTYWPWLLTGLAGSPFFIFMFRQFFAGFPKDLEDAAEIDGCSPFGTFWRIFLPNSAPVMIVVTIFAFQGAWGDFFLPTLLLNADQATLAMLMSVAYVDPKGNPLVTVTMAANVLFILPLVLSYFVCQRYIHRNDLLAGLKG